ncbi:MAG TPA: hypothetical protein VFA40_07030, partial [Terriglobales bacterium]|nr:hypothetical protein [Terriglobales bacterium]
PRVEKIATRLRRVPRYAYVNPFHHDSALRKAYGKGGIVCDAENDWNLVLKGPWIKPISDIVLRSVQSGNRDWRNITITLIALLKFR